MKMLRYAARTLIASSAFFLAQAFASGDIQTVEIRFAAEINGEPFACGRQYGPVGASASTIVPSDYRMFVSALQLIQHGGRRVPVSLVQDKVFQLEDIALLDFEDGSGPCRNGTSAVNTVVRGVVPRGAYTGLSFVIGVPFARNHGDPTLAPPPLSSTAMFWTWQGGYKFIRFDTGLAGVAPASPPMGHGASRGGSAPGYALHLGSTRCASASRTEPPSACALGNRMVIDLADFDPARHTVVVDVGPVLAESRIDYNSPKTSPGCMSFPGDPDCIPVMRRLGLPYEGAPAGLQTLIKRR